ncbi:MAG: ABC transporter permease, partial [Prevotellaceae bacterium]|nr:ABC transporter permease [Prevotellaceae bacterium]
MFDLDNWIEIFSVMRKNKLRTFLTGFSVSWGILMFCILLASGNGVKNGVLSNFESHAINSVEFWGRRTSKPYKGLPEGRRITLDERDLNLIKNQIPEGVNVSGTIAADGLIASNGVYNSSCTFYGVGVDYQEINTVKVTSGRFVNEMDLREYRKVAVLNRRLSEALFQNEDPVGKRFIADSLVYTVIGVWKSDQMGNELCAYIPFSTAQLLYNKGWGIGEVTFTVKGLETVESNHEFEKRLRQKLSVLHTFAPDDQRSIGIWNRLENYLEFVGIFNGISLFVWIIGIGTLLAGIISISNIMLITVRERTREIGIRKALGAKPSSILGSILMESALITSV